VFFAALFAVVLTAPRSSSAQSAGSVDPALITDLVYANRILYDQGVLDGFGHVSVRNPNNPSHFFLSRSMAPALVTVNDIVEYDAQGEPVKPGSPNGYLERYIHAAVYRARPDVNSVVHSHSAAILPFGLTGTPLRPVYHMSGFLGSGVPVFDIRDASGQTDMLISSNKLGDDLAKVLGDHVVVLMRGHGSVAVGKSIQEAVFRAVYAEVNSRIQMDAMKLGDVKYLSKEEAAMAAATVGAQIGRSWDLWKRRIGNLDAASH
jgi:HCOMODA/2-hydroxy-3-carboxy-muconic semialdehyde decarboxylase